MEVVTAETGLKICRFINRHIKPPIHPFNLRSAGGISYAEWQYQRGADTIKFYLKYATPDEIFKNKHTVDIGCGAGGKTMYYITQGVSHITGIEILEKYRAEAEGFAKALGYTEKFTFTACDAADMPFVDSSIDTIIMNDAMEHVTDPSSVLSECRRILAPGGRLYVNFPPYNHPFGAHLSDLIGIPWVHVFFSDKTLIKLYKELAAPLPDGEDRIAFRISKNAGGGEYFSYINKMSIKRFKKLAAACGMKLVGYDEIPLRPFLAPLAKLPGLKEYFVKMVVAVFER